MPGFESSFEFLYHSVLANLATRNIRVKKLFIFLQEIRNDNGSITQNSLLKVSCMLSVRN